MTELLAATDLLVDPDYRMFGIADISSAGEDGPVPGHGWLAPAKSMVRIGVAAEMVSSGLRLELWDAEPPSPPHGHEVQDTIRLTLPTGELGVDQITLGYVHDVFALPPGVYNVRLTGWGREQTRRAYEELENSRPDWDEHDAARQTLSGQERYLVQFWPA